MAVLRVRYHERMTTPQQLSREAIEEFKDIYEAEFRKRLSDAEVQEIALHLLRFFGMLTTKISDPIGAPKTVR